MASGERILSVDLRAFNVFAGLLRQGGRNAIEEAWKALSAWGEEYRRRVQRVTPVETGHARQSWQLIRDKENLTVTIGSSVKSEDGKPYLVYLEYGTDRIAGGKVKDWKPGEPPIMSWPAKNDELPSLRDIGPGDKRYERHTKVLIGAFTEGTGEQMPMLRPIGYEIAPEVAADVSLAMREGFQSVLSNRRNGGRAS
jgi:hypothetical protein